MVSHFSCLEHGGNELLQNDGTSPSNYMASHILYPEGGAAGFFKILLPISQTMLQHSHVSYVKVVVAGASDQTARRHVSEYHNLSFQRGENFRSLSILLDAQLMLLSKLHTCANYLCQLPRGPHQYSWVPWKRNGPLRSISPQERLHWCLPELAPRVYDIYLWTPCLLLQCVFSRTCL